MVRIITTTDELQQVRTEEKGPVAFVPTMGNLHAGHISLVKAALKECEVVYFSIFVNPKQFGPHEDFNRYPRTLENDINLLKECLTHFPNRRLIVYAPVNPAEVFPHKSERNISVFGLSKILEGAIRPGHFDGVATVVYRLFELVKPMTAYFGLKDYQQFLVIRQMVQDLFIPVEIIGMPIIREQDGLALSSRNQYLTPEEKKQGLILYHSLKEIEAAIRGKKENLPAAQNLIAEKLHDKNWNYLELRDAETLSEDISTSSRLTVLGVYQLRTTRLLDNLQLELT